MDLQPTGIPAWSERRIDLRRFLATFSATTLQVAEGFFPGRTLETRRKRAHHWLARERRRGRLRLIGVVDGPKGGRPALVYGRRCPADKIDHEVGVTRFALLYPKGEFTRGEKVGRAEPDLTMVWDGRNCFVEIDHSEHMSVPQMAAKWFLYGEAIDGFVLVVCRTEVRLERLVKGIKASPVREFALFTTFDRLTLGRVEPWVDAYGNSVRI